MVILVKKYFGWGTIVSVIGVALLVGYLYYSSDRKSRRLDIRLVIEYFGDLLNLINEKFFVNIVMSFYVHFGMKGTLTIIVTIFGSTFKDATQRVWRAIKQRIEVNSSATPENDRQDSINNTSQLENRIDDLRDEGNDDPEEPEHKTISPSNDKTPPIVETTESDIKTL